SELTGMVARLLQDRDGTVWLTINGPARVCAVRGGEAHCDGMGRFGRYAGAAYEDSEGNLWVTTATGLWRWKPGPPEQYTFPRGVVDVSSVIEIDAGILLLATNGGLKQLLGGKIQSYNLPGVTGKFRPNFLLRDSDGIVWIGTHEGLLHFQKGKVDGFAVPD